MGDPYSIQISSNLINRLSGDDGQKLKKKTKKPKTKIPQRPHPKDQRKLIPDDSETQKSIAPAGWPLLPPMFLPETPLPSANADLDAIRSVLRESERVVERLQKQEEDMLQEVTQKAKDLHDKEFKLPERKPMPCLEEKNACFECYKQHAKDPLKCANVVTSFADCARRVRQHMNYPDKLAI